VRRAFKLRARTHSAMDYTRRPIGHLRSTLRDVLEVHPRGDPAVPLAGVFATRSPHRPNPLGLHRGTVREVAGNRLRVGPIEAVDGTPVVDLKIALENRDG